MPEKEITEVKIVEVKPIGREKVFQLADGDLTADPGEEEAVLHGYVVEDGDLEEDTRVYNNIVDGETKRIVFEDV